MAEHLKPHLFVQRVLARHGYTKPKAGYGETPELETDIYTPVKLQIENLNRIEHEVVVS